MRSVRDAQGVFKYKSFYNACKKILVEIFERLFTVVVMSQQSLKRSARVQEKSSAAANVSTESIDVPDQWVYIFYFDCDDTYIRIEGNSPRWPDKIPESLVCLRGISLVLSVGDTGKRQNRESSNGKAIGERVCVYSRKCVS